MLIKLNLGYPLLISYNDKDVFKGGWITGIDVMFGKKILGGFSFDYIKFIEGDQVARGELDPSPVGGFRGNVIVQFYGIALMYKPYPSSLRQRLTPFIQLKPGLLKRQYDIGGPGFDNFNDADHFTYSIAAGIDIPFRSSLHLFANLEYVSTAALANTKDFGGLQLNASRTQVTGKLGVLINFLR